MVRLYQVWRTISLMKNGDALPAQAAKFHLVEICHSLTIQEKREMRWVLLIVGILLILLGGLWAL